MRKIKFILLGALLFLVVQFLFVRYGNKVVHRNINSYIVEAFQSNFIINASRPQKFKNMLTAFNGPLLEGTAIYSGGFLSAMVTERETALTPLQWITSGGYSADEPEIFASFRHFYDPTLAEGNRYLHNHLDALTGKDNPQIDIIDWTLKHTDHEYNWKNGTNSVFLALQSNDEKVRNKEMAFAYRALGETLHMIADMGCPAHVRDDSHAAEPFTGYNFGSPDPYEDGIEAFADIKNQLNGGVVDPDLKTYFKNATTVKDIAHKLATYTNSNYFTNQTISGASIVPLIHPEKTYHSPKLESCEYDPTDFTYRKNISGNEVIMCTDLKYKLMGLLDYRGYPYIDKKCVQSQGKALVPQIVEAGINTIRLFIPEMKVEIESFDQKTGKITGKVIHIKSDEYTRMISYNGKVSILDAKGSKKITDIESIDGKFSVLVKLSDFKNVDWVQSGIFAQIEFGGLFVNSAPYISSDKKVPTMIYAELTAEGRISMKDKTMKKDTIIIETLLFNRFVKKVRQDSTIITAVLDTTESYTVTFNGKPNTITTREKKQINITLNKSVIVSFNFFDSTTITQNSGVIKEFSNYKSVTNPFAGIAPTVTGIGDNQYTEFKSTSSNIIQSFAFNYTDTGGNLLVKKSADGILTSKKCVLRLYNW